MKFVLLFALLAVGCGKNEPLRTNLKALAGVNEKSDKAPVAELSGRVDDLENRVTALEGKFSTLESDLGSLSTSYATLTAVIASTQSELDALSDQNSAEHAQLQALLNAQDARLNTVDGLITSLQTVANQTQAELTGLVESLDAENRITGYLDPCGDHVGRYDEVLIVTNQGKVIAYFQDANKRHLTVLLPNVFYQTTDAQSCTFKVDAYGRLM